MVDDPGVERLPGTGQDPCLVEMFGDAGLGMAVEELIDLGDDRGWGAPGLWGGQPDGHLECRGLTASQPDLPR